MSLSPYNPSLTEEMLCFSPESSYLERKSRDTKATKIANELIGMLNAGGGILRNKVAAHKETIPAEVHKRIESEWSGLGITPQRIIHILFERNEITIDGLIEELRLSEQAVRANLKALESLGIVVKLSKKQRDRNAKYVFSPQ